ncbi:Protein-S-isoprenylcysteine O-methyltransferase Ste14 [Ekhidna lutea]|uniref:Protein-S-isoprenylcysteine O-methyltransferase Ste14 n=1 Tax=Ekhidna lutea TaxID=447679 RepID=A0A239M282_EKHLU|nr:isoprenylcysteine carboxylmethyltransferase family protein [Ekhidna lutea]SNT36690.1 Protein-S-isoprenylcysteine O-methyltransferase Ste14 [Ekhidna lutea]
MKLKIPPVIIFFLSLGIMFGVYYLTAEVVYSFQYQTMLSRIFLGIGVLCAFSGIISFRMKGTTVDPLRPEKASSLVTRGIYQYTRNPMYLGMGLVLIGGWIRIGSPIAVIGILFFFWYMTIFQIKPEEASLTKIFGKDYEDYCTKVRRWF